VPATAERWADLERLFGANGACGGCWCTWWRQSYKDYQQNKGEPNKATLRELVKNAAPAPGLLAYVPDTTGELRCVGWIAVAPRAEYIRLRTSRTMAALDETPVWSVSCLFVHKDFRRQGLSSALIGAAARYAFSQGAPCVEAYPHEPRKNTAAAFIFLGTRSAFERAGFAEVARHTPGRPIMRKYP
jgi:GNAT superfamily N-acetyltransferase